MRVTGNLPNAQMEGVRPVQQSHEVVSAAATTNVHDKVTLSGPAQFIRDLQREAATLPAVRMDLVEQARADIKAGRLETDELFNQAVDGLLASGF